MHTSKLTILKIYQVHDVHVCLCMYERIQWLCVVVIDSQMQRRAAILSKHKR